jgi:hypothetical protein
VQQDAHIILGDCLVGSAFNGKQVTSRPAEHLLTIYVLTMLLLVTSKFPSSVILFTLMMEAMRSSETLFLTTATRRHIAENSILHV